MRTLDEIAKEASLLNKSPTAEWIANNKCNNEDPNQGYAAAVLTDAENRLIAAAYLAARAGAEDGRDHFAAELPTRYIAKANPFPTPPRFKDAALNAAASTFSTAVQYQLQKHGGSSFALPKGILGDVALYVIGNVQRLVEEDMAKEKPRQMVHAGNGQLTAARR